MPRLTPETSCWVITDGKIGDLVQCLGVAEQLGLVADQRIVRPRPPWSWFAPRGPGDPREAPGRVPGPLAPPFPAIAIASGRRTVPALRALKRASGGQVFTVFLKDPRIGSKAADMIWVPRHDRLRGVNVVDTLTSPSRVNRAALAAARRAPDPRLDELPAPRIALVLGGTSAHHRFEPADGAVLVEAAREVLLQGYSLMVTPSRRTPSGLTAALRGLADGASAAERLFVWDNEGANPYVPMLALADAVIVTGDSVNMMGEAAVTGVPVHVIEPSGGHAKITRFIDAMVAYGAARRWSGTLERFTYQPLDPTPEIAQAIKVRFEAFGT